MKIIFLYFIEMKAASIFRVTLLSATCDKNKNNSIEPREVDICFLLRNEARNIDHITSIPMLSLFFFFLILRRMGKNKALAHHTSTYFHTRRVSI